MERSSALTKTVKSRETALARAEERVQALSDQIKKLETDAEANRTKTEKRVEELSSALQREKMERAVSDGALEATRKNYAELQRELAAERSGRREETKLELVASGAPTRRPAAPRRRRRAKPSRTPTRSSRSSRPDAPRRSQNAGGSRQAVARFAFAGRHGAARA